ncbi:sentrin sumo-specific [Colletotrichum musicola]|uniref:Sentrin sumo-specific n=1 Tax=Colletotrichum musicola TaxID=2175873 RepID=A0A8H6K2I2_9PEZI|nr:sentrin sumo-specific [Colletotrichum musicola]
MSAQPALSEPPGSEEDPFAWGLTEPELEFTTDTHNDGSNGEYEDPRSFDDLEDSLALLQASISSPESIDVDFPDQDQILDPDNEHEVCHQEDEELTAPPRSHASPSDVEIFALEDSSDTSFDSWLPAPLEIESDYVSSDVEMSDAFIDLDETSSSGSNDLETRLRDESAMQYLGTMSRLNVPDERLMGDDIETLQKILFDRADSVSSIPCQSLLAHPLWLRLGRTLPAKLPQAASTARYIFSVMHHKSPEHWTLGQLDLHERTFYHYDSLDLAGVQDQVSNEVVPWLENVADINVGISKMRGPRQDDAVNCGIHVLHVLSCLLEGRPVPDRIEVAAFRHDMLRLVLQEGKAKFPDNDQILEFESRWSFGRHKDPAKEDQPLELFATSPSADGERVYVFDSD